jgi:HSP20 family protein
MPLIPWKPMFDPFADMDAMMQSMRGMQSSEHGVIPPVDMYQTKDMVVVETPLAGVDPEKVEVSVENGVLTIKGSMEKKTEIDEKDYYRKEVRSGSVFRRVALPAAVQEGKAEASFENGLLRVEMPKAQLEAPKSVKIQVKKI